MKLQMPYAVSKLPSGCFRSLSTNMEPTSR
jgi:hypothetical protein